jgi:hypothetical protein
VDLGHCARDSPCFTILKILYKKLLKEIVEEPKPDEEMNIG